MTNAGMISDEEFLKEIRKEFLDEFSFQLEKCEESYLKLEKPEHRSEELAKIFRVAHSIKGGGAAAGFEDLALFAHGVEDCLVILRSHPEYVDMALISLLLRCGDAFKVRVEALKKGDEQAPWDVSALTEEVQRVSRELRARDPAKNLELELERAIPFGDAPAPAVAAAPPGSESSRAKEASSVKIAIDRIDSILDVVGELVVIKSQLVNRAQAYGADQSLNEMTSVLDKTVRELQDKTLGMRLTPLKSLFLKAQRTVRDLSIKLGKPIEVVLHGEETEIDRNMVELLSDPLMHIVRNAVDHGIEDPLQRTQAGKPERGAITISAQVSAGRVFIDIQDDGRGIDREAVLKKAQANGMISADPMNPKYRDPRQILDQEVFQLIFAPGFSTARVVSDISGRGVGLDVVKTNVEKLRGGLEIQSAAGRGASFRLSLPLTTSIMDGMLVGAFGCRYVMPMSGIRELVELKGEQRPQLAGGEEVLRLRERLIPLVSLKDFLGGENPCEPAKQIAVVVEQGGKEFGIRVHEVLGQSQVVLKPLGTEFSGIRGLAGSAILGDGAVALVFDLDSLSRRFSAVAKAA